jgi:drug/metabolite transporter (DMT)-like permease
VGRFIFLEPISSQHVIGIALIISGVLVMGGIEYQ